MKKLINNYKKWNPSIYAIIFILLIPFIIYLIRGFELNNDFWFLINTGKEIIKNGFINIEPFTIHSGLFFIPQQWLTDIIFSLIYNNFGIRGMYYLVLLCNGIIMFLFYKLSYLVNNNKKRSMLITIVSSLFLIWSNLLTTRPQLFDVITFTLELYLIELFIKKENSKYLYFLPLLSIFLINYHASMWFMMFVLLIPYYFEYVISKVKKRSTYKIKPLIISTVISLVCGLINPYGIEAIKYFFNSYGVTKINNIVYEMQAVSISNFEGKIIFAIIFIILYSFYHNKGDNKIRYFLLSIGIIYLLLNHYKSVLYMSIIFPLIVGYAFRKKTIDKDMKPNKLDKVVYIVGIIIFSFFIITKPQLNDGVDIKEFADYLDNNASFDIKLYTDYNNGSYMEYRGYKCYIDPRAEIFLKANNHKEDIFDEYYYLEINKLDIKEFINKYQFDYILLNSSTSFINELKNNKNYKEVISKKVDNMMTYLYKKVG